MGPTVDVAIPFPPPEIEDRSIPTRDEVEAADVALYAAKQHGRNRVVAPGVDARSSFDRSP